MYRRTALTVLLASSLATIPAVTHGAGQNEWYLFGNRIKPEEPQLQTVGDRQVVTVNGIQVFPAPQKREETNLQVSDRTRAQVDLSDRAVALKQELLREGKDSGVILAALADLFEASDLVDSVEINEPDVVRVRWRGESGWEFMVFSSGPDTDLDAIHEQRVQHEYELLHNAWELDCLVVLSSGTSYLFNPRNPDTTLDEVRAEIRRARGAASSDLQDGSWHGLFVRKAAVARELNQPRPKPRSRKG